MAVEDHLKAAAAAAAMSDDEITVALSVICDDSDITPFEQAILDEAAIREIRHDIAPRMISRAGS